jgi:RND family efflux transporter MFP subunit
MKSRRFSFVGRFAPTLLAASLAVSRASVVAAEAPAAPRHPAVNVILAQRASMPSDLVLPATLQPFQDSPIYARTTGYLARFLVDIGDTVKAGQTLAIIDAPELDRQLAQAQAALAQSRANAALAKATAARWAALARENAVSKQEGDEKAAAAEATAANVQAAEAEVARLSQLKSFETVTAPFDGVIASRGADVGTLITTDASRPQLFRLTQQRPLRVYVNVPQAYVRAVKPGVPADVLVTEFPNHAFNGQIVRASGALDAATRTLQTEVQLPNEDGQLLPGMFVQVRFHFTPTEPPLLIPSNAAIIRADGTLVASVDAQHAVHLQKIKLGRDFGTQIEVLSGLAAGAMIVANPSDALVEGQLVEPLLPAPPKSAK